MDTTSRGTEKPPSSRFYSYGDDVQGLKDWQTVLGDKVEGIKAGQTRAIKSWKLGSSPTDYDIEFDKAKIEYCQSLIPFANPDQTLEGFNKTYAEVEEAEQTLCHTEGYKDLDDDGKSGWYLPKKEIRFGVMALLCASNYGPGVSIQRNDETLALSRSMFDKEPIPTASSIFFLTSYPTDQ